MSVDDDEVIRVDVAICWFRPNVDSRFVANCLLICKSMLKSPTIMQGDESDTI